MASSEGLHASVLGAVGLSVGGTPVELRGRQRRRIVAALLADAGHPVAVSRLVDILDLPSSPGTATDPANAVQAQVRRLRELVEPGVAARSAVHLRSTPEGYVLEPDRFDLWDYESAVRSARGLTDDDPRAAIEQYEVARDLWAPPWGDLGSDDLVADLVGHLEEQHRTVEEEWGCLVLDLGQGSLVADQLLEMARREPSRERRWAAAIRGLFQASRQADALRAFDEARTTLREEFGVDPGSELTEVEQAVLRQDHSALGARRSGRAATGSRQSPLTTFVGRTDDLAALVDATERHRLVTVVGFGGVGKSRLVTEWSAASVAGPAIHFIDLRGVDHGRDIGRRIADDLGVGSADEDQIDPLDLVAATLTHAGACLVIDNAEHLADDLARVLLRLLQSIASLRVVVTSRVPLAVTGEFVVQLGPLRIPDEHDPVQGTAAELVLDRLGPGADEQTARDIARRFGGLPLPLELVAAAQDGRLRDHGDSDALAAEASIAAAVDVALRQVSPDAEHLLWRSLQFPDGASVELLDSVAATRDEGDRNTVARLLRELVGASLLDTSPSPTGVRYRGLQPLSDLARRRLTPPDRVRTIRGAGAWWGGLSRSSYFEAPDLGGIEALEVDHRNIGSTLEWLMDNDPLLGLQLVVGVTDHWSVSGRWAQARRWIELGLSKTEPDAATLAAVRMTYWYCSGGIPMVAADQHLIEAAINEIDDPTRPGEDVWAVLHLQLGVSQAWNGDVDAANASIDVARQVALAHDSHWFLATIDRYSSLGHLITGDPLNGVEIALDAADRLESVGDPSAAAGSLYHATVLGRAAGLEDQTDILLRARLLAEAGGSPGIRALVAIEAAQNARRLGHEDAAEQLDRAATLTDRAGNLRTGAITRRDLGLMLLHMGRREAAAEQLSRAVRPLLSLDRRASALGIAALSEASGARAALAEALGHAAWAMAADPSGTPLSEGDRKLLEQYVGARPDPLRPPASIEELLDEALRTR